MNSIARVWMPRMDSVDTVEVKGQLIIVGKVYKLLLIAPRFVDGFL